MKVRGWKPWAAHAGKVLAIALALGGLSGGAALAQSTLLPATVRDLGKLSQTGRWITDSAGRTILLHGGNVSLPAEPEQGRGPSWSPRTPTRMAEQGFNAVRLVLFLSQIMPEPGRIDAGFLDRVSAVVRDYHAVGIQTLIDFHQDEYSALVGVRGMPAWAVFTDGHERIPGMAFPMGYFKDPAVQHAFDNFWKNHPVEGTGKGVQDLYIDALAGVARRFRDEPGVLGIDVMNEPATGSLCAAPDPDAWKACTDLEERLLAPFYEKAAHAIGKAAPGMLVFVEPFMLQGAMGTEINTPISASEGSRGLSYHNYGPVKETRDRVNDGALALALGQRAAILNTEWGFDNDPAVIAAQADDFDARLIPWLAWPRGAFEALADPDLDNRGNGNRLALLRAYARPYPQAVAGTPLSLAFDAEAGIMRLRYSTQLPSGAKARPGLATEIAVPQANYPSGYQVTVTGGTVTSPTGAARLVLQNLPGAREVNVTLTRTGTLAPLPSDPASSNAADEALYALPPIPDAPLTRKSLLGHIVLTPGGREALESQVPGLMTGLKQLQGWEKMTLVQVQQLAGGALDEPRLAAIDAALARLSVTPGPVKRASPSRLGIDSFTSDLLADPKARAIILREAPGLETSPQRALFPQTRLRDLQPLMPEVLTNAVLDRIAKGLEE